ncbi:hypothetical protein NC651_040322 [Populus alba x Populus x berolinensis]|nr:hypothetical protein NC651_040322 [Populus alba x Populus x berolinensis]
MGKLCKNIERSMKSMRKARKRVEERQQSLSGPQPRLCHFQCSIFHFFTWKLFYKAKESPTQYLILDSTASLPSRAAKENSRAAMATELEELVGFLFSPSPPVKKAAVEIARDLTGSEYGLLSLSKHASTVLPSLSQLLKDKEVVNINYHLQITKVIEFVNFPVHSFTCWKMLRKSQRGTAFIPTLQCMAGLACRGIARLQFCISRVIIGEVSEPAAEALINLSLNSNLAAKMVEMGMIKTTMDVLYKPDSSITRLLVMLLVNLTQLDSGIVSLLQIEDEKMQGLFVMKLVRSFCRSFDETRALLLPAAGKKIYSEDDASKMPLELGNVLSFEREPWDDPEIRVEALESIYLITVQVKLQSFCFSFSDRK